MIIFKSINKLNKEVNFKADIGFVPTMGGIAPRTREFDKEITKKMQKNISKYIC